MKLIHDILQDRPANAQEAKAQAPKEQRFLGSEKRVKGHILFEFNTKTGDLSPCQLTREVSVGLDGNPVYLTKAYKRADCVYVQALNEKNALKKLLKGKIIRK